MASVGFSFPSLQIVNSIDNLQNMKALDKSIMIRYKVKINGEALRTNLPRPA